MSRSHVRGFTRFVWALVAAACLPCAASAAAGQETPGLPASTPLPDVAIESFAPTRAFAVGTNSVGLVATVRNSGGAPLPAGVVMVRLDPVAGLDYLEGATRVRLPAMEPNATATLRWRLLPKAPDSALVAALGILQEGRQPLVRVLPIHHVTQPVRGERASTPKAPAARARRDEAVLENADVRVRVARTNGVVSMALLSARAVTGWRELGTSVPILEVLSAEPGQRPFWEVFRAETVDAAATKTEARLALTGTVGMRWRATLDLTVRLGSAAVDARVRLSPQRAMRVSGLRLLPFAAGDGSFGGSAAEALGPEPSGSVTVTAVRWGEFTTGLLWPSEPPLPGWLAVPLASPDGADYRRLGVEFTAGETPTSIDNGAMVTASVRWFALTGSASVRDSMRVGPPAVARRARTPARTARP
ncbi:MAG: hypothetical protein IT208_13510 [Chthonomonadales bacterium]|nr:hypothetical protein [Chthonomonadales bacterium]